MSTSPSTDPAPNASQSPDILAELHGSGLRHAILRSRPYEVTVLVEPDALTWLGARARSLGLDVGDDGPGRALRYSVPSTDDEAVTVHMTAELAYRGPLGRLRTAEPEIRIFRRARLERGRWWVAPQDELVDTLLHCILDVRSFPVEQRSRLQHVMAELRGDPPAAGRAAERVQFELAPALVWSDLLRAVVEGRWEELVGRRRRLVRRLLPATLRYRLAGVFRKRGSPASESRGAPGGRPSPVDADSGFRAA